MQKYDNVDKGNPHISVIMGVYNGERFLREAVNSILQQTYSNFEFIICNDCSNDGSSLILEEYRQLDKRIVVINNVKNLGLAASLNKCLEKSRGEYIARMDCDDIALPNRFEEQIKWMEKYKDVCAVGSSIEYINDKGLVYGRCAVQNEEFYELKDAVKASKLVHPSVMMRKESVVEVGGYTVNSLTTRAEDYDLWCKLCERGYVIANMPQILFHYREDDSNLVRRKYKYRVQEARLKFYWIRKANRPIGELYYALRPLLVGLIPMWAYKILHLRKKS